MTKAPQFFLTSPMASVLLPPMGILPGEPDRLWATQGLFSGVGEVRRGGARHVLSLSFSLGPDCDGNGTSDCIDVLFGSSPDLNHNLIPDGCQGG